MYLQRLLFYEEPFAGALGKKVSKLGPLLAIVGVAHVPAGDLFSSSNISSGLHDDAEHPISDATVPYLLGRLVYTEARVYGLPWSVPCWVGNSL
jgi:hypothetical protein